jgi:translation initiation factor 3 subunit D
MDFALPTFHENKSAWGPTTCPTEFVGIPYSDFSKTQRLNHIADFTAAQQRWMRESGRTKAPEESKEDKFSMVDTTKIKKQQRLGQGRGGGNRQGWRQQKAREERKKTARTEGASRQNRRYHKLAQARRAGWRSKWNDKEHKESSLNVKSSWKIVSEFETAHFAKLRANRPEVTDLKDCGDLKFYDGTYDRVNMKRPKKLKRFEERDFYYVTAFDDPIIEEFASDPKTKVQVFTTDAVVTHIMCCARAQVPWDIKATRVGNKLFLDKRSGSTIDLLTVNETAKDPPSNEDPDAINSATKLSIECTQINQNFSQQILDESKEGIQLGQENPFHDDEDAEEGHSAARICYRYRKYDMGGLHMICRTEIHGVLKKQDKFLNFTTCALNEWDAKAAGNAPWRTKLARQPRGVLASELKNNSMKLAKWTAASHLAGADLMKIGFVKRKSPKDPYNHEIVHTMVYEPLKFALQINLSIDNMWGVLKMMVETLLAQDAGIYVILKDANKDIVRVYSVPDDEFDSDESSGDDESDESSDDEE